MGENDQVMFDTWGGVGWAGGGWWFVILTYPGPTFFLVKLVLQLDEGDCNFNGLGQSKVMKI